MREAATIRTIERAMIRISRTMGRRDLGRQVERSLGARLDLSFLLVIGAVDELTESKSAPTIKDIARYLDVHHSRASRLVKDTIRAGFVMRLASQEDARKSPLALNDKGRAIAGAIHAARAKYLAARLHGMSKADRRHLARLLERFAENDSEAHRKNDPVASSESSSAASRAGSRKRPKNTARARAA
jgi:DNA-binding MarR family transcriptional regulator